MLVISVANTVMNYLRQPDFVSMKVQVAAPWKKKENLSGRNKNIFFKPNDAKKPRELK